MRSFRRLVDPRTMYRAHRVRTSPTRTCWVCDPSLKLAAPVCCLEFLSPRSPGSSRNYQLRRAVLVRRAVRGRVVARSDPSRDALPSTSFRGRIHPAPVQKDPPGLVLPPEPPRACRGLAGGWHGIVAILCLPPFARGRGDTHSAICLWDRRLARSLHRCSRWHPSGESRSSPCAPLAPSSHAHS